MAYVAIEFMRMSGSLAPEMATERIVIYCDPKDAPRYGTKVKVTIEET